MTLVSDINRFIEIPYSNITFINNQCDISIGSVGTILNVDNFEEIEVVLNIEKGIIKTTRDNKYKVQGKFIV